MNVHNNWKSYGSSHCGNVRSSNQDHFFSRDAEALWCVADGMGGHKNGKQAAVATCNAVASEPLPTSQLLGDKVDRIASALNSANRQHWREYCSRQETSGATFVTLTVSGNLWSCLWAGDSRAYSWDGESLQQITHDHRPDPQKSAAVSKAFGVSPTLDTDMNVGLIEPSQRFLLCSDGLNDAISDASIISILSQKNDLKTTSQQMITAALDAGGRDNVTVVLCENRS